MPDTASDSAPPTPAPAAPAPAPAPTMTTRSGPRRGGQAAPTPPPAQPGPVAGHPVGTVPRLRSALPPGLPPEAAAALAAAGTGLGAPAEPLHPSFAPMDPKLAQAISASQTLRSQLQAALGNGKRTLEVIDAATTTLKDASPEVLATLGIDLAKVQEFRDGIAALIKTASAA